MKKRFFNLILYLCSVKPRTERRNRLTETSKHPPMKRNHLFATLICVLVLTGCGHATLGKLVGSDRDEHGCIGSAGYTWSYALHDCVRLWEAGIRFDTGPQSVFLVFSTDSTFAEIFPQEGNSVICKRVKNTQTWKPRKGEESVYIQNDVICVKVDDYTYTHSK